MRLRYPVAILYLAAAILAATFSLAYAEEKTPFLGEVNTDSINLRSDATTTAAVIATLNKGEQLDVVAEFYEWYKVRLPKKAPVYIKKSLVLCINYAAEAVVTEAAPKQQCLSAKVLKDRVNIRSKPSESGSILGIADKNEVVNITADAGSWYKIEPIQNSFGWIHKKFVVKAVISPPEKNPEGDIILTGTVQPYGIVFLRPATHKLITAENEIFLLKGNRSSLNALNHQKVKVTGKVRSSLKGQYPVVEVKAIEVVN